METDNLKFVYLELLQGMLDTLAPHQEQLHKTYSKAKANLQECEGIFYHPKDLKKVKGIGDTIIKRLETKLESYCTLNNMEFPTFEAPHRNASSGSSKRSVTSLRVDGNNKDDEQQPTKKKRKYIPKKKSGGYAILLGLLELNAIRRPCIKEEIIEISQKYSNGSMHSNYATKEFYGAWSSISSLLKHSLVLEEGRPKRYSLTPEGLEMAKTLKMADSIEFNNDTKTNTLDISLDLANERTVNLSDLLKQDGEIRRNNESSFNSAFSDVSHELSHSLNASTPQRSRVLQNMPPLHSTPTTNINDRQNNSTTHSSANEKYLTGKVHMNRKRFTGISYEIWKNGSYEIYPIIDHREVKSQQDRDYFSNALKLKGVKMEVRQLSLGDIIWVARHTKTGFLCVLNTIIERKRLDDLAASIKDNRFMEQKNRLDKSGCTNKYYLIEETMASSVFSMTEALKTSLWMILIYYRFSVIRSQNSNETVQKLHVLHTVIKHNYSKKNLLVMYPNNLKDQDHYRRILEKFQLEFGNHTSLECCHTLDCFQEIMGKNDSPTVGEMTIQILMYVKGVSLEKAVAIQAEFPTLNHILTAYRNCSSQLEAKMLMFQKLGNAPGNKKISKLLSEKIADAFM
ncbi:similar to Saccharomyces cerevisiae YDR386W MUS81 Subunit of the structure-specific Mms4p- Mus81p endonuclease that cleaves branched DNA [Maudiozyma barnettii]|uniref:Crossover junction endonuclease MUS81 n=1 Tax=Maudiozyma barnettii TaxID=61262 RepID=A0A8H2VDZ8_9SACH|nr:Mus81p [Kazachstania barnettii]CAB4253735.1 similar to Saccharomyces cerevisiae YDR386W MUS81 Subunit of the structure-specific Mms4p- Mus81p endonuclease that cleaves branched DNA [Kazachstania barnettii]CAD1781483.1 similar to Saccharomyces cerevisiae YDR386W MUS81 Subunit of the structure-specific Mms4p- Mus81p endonuclease that cleaves branched DNA [Kazachstania barnettii]